MSRRFKSAVPLLLVLLAGTVRLSAAPPVSEAQWREGLRIAHIQAAQAVMEAGDHARALRLYTELLERHPRNPAILNNLAWLRIQTTDPAIRDLDRALREAQEAVMGAADDFNIWNTLGEVYLVRGDVVRAMRYAVLARDMAAAARVADLSVYQDLVRRCEESGRNR